jgi:hypothetical protein
LLPSSHQPSSNIQFTSTKTKNAKEKRKRKKVNNLREGKEDLQINGAREEPTNRGSIAMENLNATPNALG